METGILTLGIVNVVLLLLLGWWVMYKESRRESYYLEFIPEEYLENAPLVAGQCDADCTAPAKRDGKIWCNNTRACTNAGTNCKCYLWRKEKGDPDAEWEKLPKKKHPYEKDTYFYRCWCTT